MVEIVKNASEFGLFHGSYAGAVAVGTLVGGGLLSTTGDSASALICAGSGIFLASFAYPIVGRVLYSAVEERRVEMSKNSMEHSSDDADDDDDQEVLFVSATLLESSLLDESTPAEPPRSEPLVQCMWPRGMLLVYCMVGLIGSIAEGGLIVWTPEFFEDNLGATTLTKQFGLAAFMLGEFITRWRMVDYLRQRYGRRRPT